MVDENQKLDAGTSATNSIGWNLTHGMICPPKLKF